MNYCPTVYTAWIDECEVPALTICGGEPFTVPTYPLVECPYSDFVAAERWFRRNDYEPQYLEDTVYDLSRFDVEADVLDEIEAYLNGEALEIENVNS